MSRDAALLAWDAARWVSGSLMMSHTWPHGVVGTMTPKEEAAWRAADAHLAACERAVGHEFARTTPSTFPLALAVEHAAWCATFKRAA